MVFKRLFFVALLLVLGFAVVSYAQDTEEAEVVLFVGTVDDLLNEFVGLAVQGEDVIIYICDGQPDEGTVGIAQWFIGKHTDNAVSITAANGNMVELTIDGDNATGTFTFTDGTTKTFVLALSETAQLHRSEFTIGEDKHVGGWIVLEDGSVRGAVFTVRADATEQLVPASLVSFSNLISLKREPS